MSLSAHQPTVEEAHKRRLGGAETIRGFEGVAVDTHSIVTYLQSLSIATSRRRLLSALTGGALAAAIVAPADDAAAKKRKKNKKNRRRKKKNSKTAVTATCSGSSFRINTSGDRRLAQPFVAQVSGPLVRVALEVDQRSTDGVGDYVLRVGPVDDASVPTNQVLAESRVAGASVPDGLSTVSFDFADPFSLRATGNRQSTSVRCLVGGRPKWRGLASFVAPPVTE